MKKKFKSEKMCLRIVFFFLLQIAMMVIMKSSTSTTRTTTSTTITIIHPDSPATATDYSGSSKDQGHEEQYTRWRTRLGSISSDSAAAAAGSHLSVQSSIVDPPPSNSIICDRSNRLYDWCHLKRPTILEPATATFYTRDSAVLDQSSEPHLFQKEEIRPYPRKNDIDTMSRINDITLTTAPLRSSCQIYHDTPALVFSTGGFTGNFFHDFNDGFVPLFVTLNTLFPDNQEVTLVITDFSEWWYSKYEAILPQFSPYPVINLDNQTVTHCFSSVAAGLITHGPMTIHPELIPNGKSFLDFRSLLDEGYRQCLVWPPPKVKGRPRLVLVSRKGNEVGRVILNEDILIKTAQEEGFEVVVFEPNVYTYLCAIYRMINSSHAMIGVHGAALTHSLFLRPSAAFIQVVPLGNDWLADKYFKNLAKGMKLEYMEYKIKREESSLAEKYGMDHELVNRAMEIAGHNWSAQHHIYLKGQDVRLDIGMFREFLKKAYVKAVALMRQQGLRVRKEKHKGHKMLKNYVPPLVFQ